MKARHRSAIAASERQPLPPGLRPQLRRPPRWEGGGGRVGNAVGSSIHWSTARAHSKVGYEAVLGDSCPPARLGAACTASMELWQCRVPPTSGSGTTHGNGALGRAFVAGRRVRGGARSALPAHREGRWRIFLHGLGGQLTAATHRGDAATVTPSPTSRTDDRPSGTSRVGASESQTLLLRR